MDVLVNLRTFLAVTRYGGFSEAARHLHVVPSVTAKRISQLEKTVGARLFERSTRKVSLTKAGQQLLTRAAGVIAGFDDLVKNLRRDEGTLQGHIRLMAPTTLTMLYLGEVLNVFLREHEGITLEIALIDRSVSPLEEGFDIAISGRSATFDGVIDIPLCPVGAVLCAAPSYLERRGSPADPRELSTRDCLVFKPTGSDWQFQSSRGPIQVQVLAKLTADDNQTLRKAAEAGQGIALLPQYVAEPAFKAGTLMPLLPAFPPQETWFKAYVPRSRQELPRIKALLEWVTQHMQRLVVSTQVGSGPKSELPGSTNRNRRGSKAR